LPRFVVERLHPGTDVADERHQTLGFQPADRLPYRHRADVEFARQATEREPDAGAVAPVEDAFADVPVGDLVLGEVDRLPGGRGTLHDLTSCSEEMDVQSVMIYDQARSHTIGR